MLRKKTSTANRYFDVLTNCMKNMDENKHNSTAVNLEKEDQEDTKLFPLFHSQFGKMALTRNLTI